MHVDEQTVRRIARLARLKITDAEAKGLEAEISGILDWVEQLKQVVFGQTVITSILPMLHLVVIKNQALVVKTTE